MLINLLVLLLMLVLTVIFAWLTVRAVRARKLWVKIAGALGAGLLTLLLAVVTFYGGKGMREVYSPAVPPAPNLTVAATPEQLARGEYLVNMSCIGCHSAVGPDGAPAMQHPLNGGWNIAAAEGFGFVGDMVAENLTPGGKLAGYSDGELFRTLRHRVGKDGTLLAFMSLLPYAQLSDEDTEAIVAYLRSLPPTAQTGKTGDSLSVLGVVMFGAGLFGTPEKGAASVTAPPQGVSAEYGRYVAVFGECSGCHGQDMTGTAASAVAPAIPNPRPLVGTLSEAQFVTMLRTGVKPDGQPFSTTMPWEVAARMTDDDLAALFLYLTAPVR